MRAVIRWAKPQLRGVVLARKKSSMMNNDIFKRKVDRLPQIEFSHVDGSPASFFPKQPGTAVECLDGDARL